jgi:Family of unknown function (DUF6152)
MRLRIALSIALAAATLGALPALAHHSFAAEYDAAQKITLKGTINSVEWVNPHSWVLVDVTDADGKVTTWRCETAPPNGLFRRGWTKNSLKVGQPVTVEGYRAKDGSATMSANSVTTADGKRMFAGSAGDGSPQREGDSNDSK